MDVTQGLCAMLAGLLFTQDVPVVVIGEMRELKVVELAGSAGLVANARDPNLEGVSPEVTLRTEICVGRIWSECKESPSPPKPTGAWWETTRRLSRPNTKKDWEMDHDASAEEEFPP